MSTKQQPLILALNFFLYNCCLLMFFLLISIQTDDAMQNSQNSKTQTNKPVYRPKFLQNGPQIDEPSGRPTAVHCLSPPFGGSVRAKIAAVAQKQHLLTRQKRGRFLPGTKILKKFAFRMTTPTSKQGKPSVGVVLLKIFIETWSPVPPLRDATRAFV